MKTVTKAKKAKNKPLAVCISDIHYSLNTLVDADTALFTAIDEAHSLEVPLIIAGDLHDTKAMLRGECVNQLVSTMEKARKLGVEVILIPGNHDKLNEKAEDDALHFLDAYCQIIREPQIYKGLEFVPYEHNPQVLSKYLKGLPEGSIVIMHQGLIGADMGHYAQDPSAVSPEDVAHLRVISGHYHKAQDIDNFSYLGNPYTLTFGEAEHPPKGFAVLYSDGTLERKTLDLRRHVVVDMDISEVNKEVTASPDNLHWIKIRGPKSELLKIKKETLTEKYGPNVRLDLIPYEADTAPTEEDRKPKSEGDLLDEIIDRLGETDEQKDSLKALWRELMA